MNKVDIVFVINSFNRLNLLKESLIVLSKWIPVTEFKDRIGIVIFEAGSTDGSIEWIKNETGYLGLTIKLIIPEKGEDTSFAAGLNTGVAHAQSVFPSLKYLVFYETDNQILSALPVEQAIKQLENNDKLAACGFTVRRHNGSPAGVGMPFLKVRNFALGKNIINKFQLEAINYKWQNIGDDIEFSEVDVVFTSPLVVKIDAWLISGGLDAQMFPFSACDVDWAKRLANLGWKMGVIKTADVIHDNLEALSAWSKNRAMSSHRGRLRYFKRHHPYKIYFIWPFALIIRHSLEYFSAKLFIKNKVRKQQLSGQFLGLLKACFNHYE